MFPKRENPVISNENEASQSETRGGPSLIEPPTISLPKGGGAIRGMGEKFAANPVTGTASLSVPIATSPNRSGFGPQLSLAYDSGGGNGPFGLGWNLSLPSITRKTDKGLPKYEDDDESDVFILSGAEDLVPVFIENPGNEWARQETRRIVGQLAYKVEQYRPRIEGLFARIERWTNQSDLKDCFWRSISKDNVTTWYGRTIESRISDPDDETKIFSWLISESHDDKGNSIVYGYKPENSQGLNDSQAHERNRTDKTRSANRYLKRIRYGNHEPYLPQLSEVDPWPEPPGAQKKDGSSDWFFEIVFDYGEHYSEDEQGQPSSVFADDEQRDWPVRKDPFSSYRAGFEVRTYRLCRRVLMFHHFPVELRTNDYLVHATHFAITENRTASFITEVTQSSYKLRENGNTYLKKSLPPVEFKYSKARIDQTVREVDEQSLENLPIGLDDSLYHWVDLDGEGLSGILTEQAGAWFYKRNLSALPISSANGNKNVGVRFAPLEQLQTLPSQANLNGGQQLLDLAGDGQLDVVEFDSTLPGFFERTVEGSWETFRSFTTLPNVAWKDPNLRFVDLSGDGHADILVTEDEVFTWYPSLAEEGFGQVQKVRHQLDEETGPRLVFADGTNSIYLSDLSGDGLSDLVRIRNGEVCYWPNLGYGRFGAKVLMDHSPWFDNPDRFDQKRIRLADIDGSGVVDIIYLAADGVQLYFNQCGNRWSDVRVLSRFPRIDNLSSVHVTDLFGNGTACLVWSSPLPGDARRSMRYIDLMGGQKPGLLIKTINNLGAETKIEYAPSTKFYLADKFAGKPWITKLPFPVHCVERVTVADKWRNTKFATTYSYHHGYFDGGEREFRGFGRVEQIDTEDYGTFADGNILSPYITDDKTLYQPPVKTVTWFHTGAFLDQERILSHYKEEYFPRWIEASETYKPAAFRENDLPEPDLAQQDLSANEWREALRACKGIALRQEVYELDVDALTLRHEQVPVKLFSASYHNCHVQRLQPKLDNSHAVFLVTESEAITYNYELDLKAEKVTPDPRVTHSLNLKIDKFGQVLQAAVVAYPRWGRHVDPSLPAGVEDLIAAVQTKPDPALIDSAPNIAYTESIYTNTIDDLDDYRVCLPWEVKTFELTGVKTKDISDGATPDTRDDVYLSIEELRRLRFSDQYSPPASVDVADIVEVTTIPYQQVPVRTIPEKRLVEHVRTLYFNDQLTDALEARKINRLGIPYETYKFALTKSLLTDIFEDKLDPATVPGQFALSKLDSKSVSGFLSGPDAVDKFGPDALDQYWMCSGIAGFNTDAAQHFYLPEKYTDPFDNITMLEYDGKYDLFIQATTDALGNRSGVFVDPNTGNAHFDYRVLAPAEFEDINGNRGEVCFDVLGLVVAVAVKGKGAEADDLSGFTDEMANPDLATVLSHFDVPSLPAEDVRPLFSPMLANATIRFLYHFGEKIRNNKIEWADRPAGACTIAREQHTAPGNSQSPLQIAFECSDGMGTVLMKRSQAEPEQADGPLRWIVSGKTILNNKGKPVKQYEPYFSSVAKCCAEGDVHEEVGVTSLMYYDSAGRLVRTEMHDGTLSRVEFSPWHVKSFDANDTVTDSRWYRQRLTAIERNADPNSADSNEETKALTAPAEDKRTARLTSVHSETPSLVILDSLGRDVIEIAHNRIEDTNGPSEFDGRNWRDEYYVTFTKLDAEGKPLWIRDARGNLVMQYITPTKPTRAVDEADQTKIESMPANSVPCYDIAGNLLFQRSMDAGDRWMLTDAAGKPMLAWDYNSRQDENNNYVDEQRSYFTEYDQLHRPTARWLSINNQPRVMFDRLEYRDTANSSNQQLAAYRAANVLGQLVRQYDASGLSETVRRDFNGNIIQSRRRLNNQPTESLVDWNSDPNPLLQNETFTQLTEFDALNRITRQYNWHVESPAGSGNSERVSVYLPQYNERGALAEETLLVRARKVPGDYEEIAGVTQSQRAITNINYNARGQKTTVELGNGTTSRYTYDRDTFRLVHLFTRRDTRFNGDCDSGTANDERPLRPCGVQNVHYTYDPVGNITHIQDDAQQTIYFDNAVVEPSNDYVYDALYRLTSAKGRETAQGGEAARDSKEPSYASGFPITNQTLRNYTETYEFDSVGNFVRFRHAIQGDTTNSWTREYRYAFDDPLQSASNRLWQTWTGGNPANATTYDHDPHGNMLNLARTAPRFNMRWDHRDMIGSIDLGGGGWAYYQYDSSKQRTRKYIKRNGGIEERIYLGGYELYRRTVGGEVVEEIESHHLFEGEQRVLFVDDVIIASDVNTHPRPDGLTVNAQTLFRYQYSNHLGSACLELDEQAEIISYEEYHPYGTSAFRAMNDQVEAPPKRYRYTGMERDEESGLNYHGARSYAPWLMRWVSCDPSAFADGVNLYQFVSANPSTRIDRTGRSSQKTGGEVETVRPFLENFARRYSLQYVTEVSFEVNVPGLGSIPGRPDYLFAMPGAKSKRLPPFLFIETKGWNLQDFTENQEIYIPLLTSLRGSQVRLMDNRARRFGLRSGRVLDVNEDSFLVLGRPNMQNFPNAYFQYSSGKTYPYSLVSRSGELKFAETQAEFYALLKQEGINPASLAAPGSGGSIKAGWTSGWKTRVGGTASLGLILYSMLAPSIAEAGVQNQLEEKLQAMDPALGVARTERPNSWAVLQIQYDVDAPPEGITQVVGVRASFRMVPPNQSPLNFIDQLRSIPNLYAGTLYVGHPEASYYLIPPVNMTPGPVMPKN